MKLPYLSSFDTVTCKLYLSDGTTDDNGALEIKKTLETKCNYSEKAESVRDKDGFWTRLKAVIRLKGDVAPELSRLTGEVELLGDIEHKYTIVTYDRPRNPDGSVNHTKIGLM